MFSYRTIIIICAAVGLCTSGFSGEQASTEFQQSPVIAWDVLDSGGGITHSAEYSDGGSLGQIAPGVSVVEGGILTAGYWAGIDSLPPGVVYACGDCNGDGRVTVADATYLVGYIYRGAPAPVGEGDVNLDTRITIADATYIVSFIYRGGPAPCEPPVSTPARQKMRIGR